MEFITLELRPRLQSCNVFIAMRQDSRLKKKVKVKLSESNIILVLEESSVNFSLPSVKVIPTSLSALSVTSNWICFRLQMAPSEFVFGSFSREIITDSSRTVETTVTRRSPSILNDLRLLFESSECNVSCTCCKSIISKSINFKRFLPLPDTDYDPNEWFCCKHASKIIPSDLRPRETDYLYGCHFSALRQDIFLADNVQVNDGALICKKCSLHIGMPHAYGLFKLWNCCVDYKGRNDAEGPSNSVNATDPLDDFLMLVKVSLSESLGQPVEIILQTSIGKRIHYLRIRPMDRGLNLMTEPSHGVNHDNDIIFLQHKQVAKVLYRYGTSDTIATTVNNIDNAANVTHHEASLTTIEAGLKYLSSSTERLPHVHRTVATEDSVFGYIVLRSRDDR
ncbi:hypothetical protein HN011_000206 [Eciton burchellii]|nr:hypothetical protein HN011_000206 [Eciton burchellii]